MIQSIRLDLLDPHPDNPRLELREQIVAAICEQLKVGGYDEAYAILARPLAGRFQIINGHHRVESARRAGLESVPTWVREMSDEEAFMQLVLANLQSGLTPLERGKHALTATTRYGKDGRLSRSEYAKQTHVDESTVRQQMKAWAVYQDLGLKSEVAGKSKHLTVIHAAPRHLWPLLVRQMVEQEWTVRQTQAEVYAVRKKDAELKAPPLPAPRKPAIIVPLSKWKEAPVKLTTATKGIPKAARAQMNDQDSTSIEWAKWSWNPVTGCLHNCPYCYARDIAERFYPTKFEPAFWPDRLRMPHDTPVPSHAERDISYKNVFTCSMADLFGQWVPTEWIDAVLKVVRDCPQWNFLFLTKFPQRMAEFEYPDNAWLGTTVDLQARVKNAERAMAKVKAKVKWLSLEPLIEPLRFENLGAFQWVVVGGASASTQTPEWRPPNRWIWELTFKAQDAGCLVYHKTNLYSRLRQFPGDGASEPEPAEAPELFHYLKATK